MSVIRAYLQLVRFPAVFSAMTDIGVGFLLTHQSLPVDGCPLRFLLLLAASCGLYLAGMAFNDIFDRDIDARERPNRPIPSGRVPLRNAILFASGLLMTGLIAAAFAGRNSLIVAGVLTAAVFAYDGLLKSTVTGPMAMGLCRTLNVLLGASAAGDLSLLTAHPTITLAGCYGVTIAGLTWFARKEATQSPRKQLIAAAVVINAGLFAMFVLALSDDYGFGGKVPRFNMQISAAVIVIVVNRALFLAIVEPSAVRVQQAVKTMLQWLIMLNATLVFAVSGNAVYALCTAALMLPAVLIGRWVFVT